MIAATTTFVLALLLAAGDSAGQRHTGHHARFYDRGSGGELTREIQIKQGLIKGRVIEPSQRADLPKVDRFLGLPYAAAPVGPLRFMPPGAPPHWYEVKVFDTLKPVCPQNRPLINKTTMSLARYNYMQRLLPFLRNQSEDCLYLNVYAPAHVLGDSARKYPVMVFIHGESFEWNSGNPYDGSVLAAYGKVVVVTLNFRLGILGFMKPGIAENTPSNFGLLDQIAALQWVQENIGQFGGNPASVTLMGHGTGAACVNFLMVSPVSRGADQGLFHRAILMSGSALSDWALVANPDPFTMQVADGLNCSPPKEHSDEMAVCLRGKRLDQIMSLQITGPKFMTKFGPVVDGAVIPNEPFQVMSVYNDLFSRYDLMYGLTEIESYHLLGAVSLAVGMLEKDFESMLRAYLLAHFENSPDVAYIKTISEYTDIRNDGARTRATDHRDTILDILSDARVAAPLVKTAKLHSVVNPKSYFYVFGHNSFFGDYANMDNSVSGEELPFVFGIPLGGPKFHYITNASKDEIALSEHVMKCWTNFAKTGNPNAPRRFDYFSQNSPNLQQFDIDWPEYEVHNQSYLNFGIPPVVGHQYRNQMMQFWNKILPQALEAMKQKIKDRISVQQPPSWLHQTTQKVTSHEPIQRRMPPIYPVRPVVVQPTPAAPSYPQPNPKDGPFHTKLGHGISSPQPDIESSTLTMNLVISLGILFLIANILAFTGLYYKRDKLRARERSLKQDIDNSAGTDDIQDRAKTEHRSKLENSNEIVKGCNVIKMIKSTSKTDQYEAVKIDEKESQGSSKVSPRFKLARQFSTSTIDPHTKVRDWIAQEIVQRCSPKFLRRARSPATKDSKSSQSKGGSDGKQKKKTSSQKMSTETESQSKTKESESQSTLGRSPTRPVSPIYSPDSGHQSIHTSSTQTTKTSGIPVNKTGTIKKPQKVSVAIDATPAARSNSVLKQQPIELTKSLDIPGQGSKHEGIMRRSATMEDFLENPQTDNLRRSTSINLQLQPSLTEVIPQVESTMVKIEHAHSKSDPVQTTYHKNDPNALYAYTSPQIPLKLQTFNSTDSKPVQNVNVTSREEPEHKSKQSTPEEALQTIKRRNYPKVLPDLPSGDRGTLTQILAQKRRSLPPPGHLSFLPSLTEMSISQPTTPTDYKTTPRVPPAPPPRTSSTLGRKPVNTTPISTSMDEGVKSTLHVGPLIPKRELRKPVHVTVKHDPDHTQPIYDNIPNSQKPTAKTIISANQPMKRADPKVVIKPTLLRKPSDPNKLAKNIPHVTASNLSPPFRTLTRQNSQREEIIQRPDPKSKLPKLSLAPEPPRPHLSDKSSDSSNSTMGSSGSDTGTVKHIA